MKFQVEKLFPSLFYNDETNIWNLITKNKKSFSSLKSTQYRLRCKFFKQITKSNSRRSSGSRNNKTVYECFFISFYSVLQMLRREKNYVHRVHFRFVKSFVIYALFIANKLCITSLSFVRTRTRTRALWHNNIAITEIISFWKIFY